jgi:hypothetical protein
MSEQRPTGWDPATGMVVTPEQGAEAQPRGVVDTSEQHELAVDEVLQLITKGVFTSPRQRAEAIIVALQQEKGAAARYLSTLTKAQREIDAHIWEDGIACPCCGQFCKVYRRRLNAGQAQALILMWRTAGRDWVHVPTLASRSGGDPGKMRHWGLIEEAAGRREDGGRRGSWRITERGQAFVLGELTVPQYVSIFDNRVLGHDGPNIGIREALGGRFNYDELMRGV